MATDELAKAKNRRVIQLPPSNPAPAADAMVISLAKLGAMLNYLAGVFGDHENVDEDHSWMQTGPDPIVNPPARGATHAIRNVRQVMRDIVEAGELANVLPTDVRREVKEALTLADHAIGQADVPAKMALDDGDEDEAVKIAGHGLLRAHERSGATLERLAARISVLADEVRTAPDGGDDNALSQAPALTKSEWLTLYTLASFDAAKLASVEQIADAMDPTQRLSLRTIGDALKKLIALHHAERPEGERHGARATVAGRRMAAKIAD